MPFVVVDIETTGLSKTRHKITEIGCVKSENGKVLGEFHTLVNPEVEIPPFITRLTGISNDLVADSPKIGDTMGDFIDFLGNATFVAHNASFDYGFLTYNAALNDLEIKNRRLCTRKLANRLVPHLRSKRLAALCDYFKIINEQEHRAIEDARVTMCIFNNFLARLEKLGITETADVIRFERSSKKAIYDKYGTPW